MGKQKSLDAAIQNPEQAEKFKEDITATIWLGEVVSNKDPLFMGRCKIKVFEKYDDLPVDIIPWAYPVSSDVFAGGESKGFGSFHTPKLGAIVRVRFNNGDIYSPEYYSIEAINTAMQTEIKDSYDNAHVVVYDEDEDMKVIYTQKDGLKIWHKKSYLTIDKESHITLEHSGGTSKMTYIDGSIKEESNADITEKSPYIYLDGDKVDVGHGADEAATKCNSLIQLLVQLAAQIDAKVPSSPGVAVQLVNGAMSNICSKIVKIA
jgi:hypothetical protein